MEKMVDFFTSRVDEYDNHMINNVYGCKDGYIKMAKLIPNNVSCLLDLGCGTGLELDEIFKVYPSIKVTGIDLTQAMLVKLQEKHSDKNLKLINANYFDYEFGEQKFDVAISFQTMHHFSHDDKIKLYTKIFKALENKGVYIECDYMVTDQAVEDYHYKEIERLRKEQNIADGEFYHYDTPCTIENQISMLKKAGFIDVYMVWRVENTTIIIAKK